MNQLLQAQSGTNPATIARAQRLSVELPIKTGAGLNDRLHWRQRSRLVK